MYENKFKNPISTKRKELDIFLQLIADLDEELELFAIGGTAMVLKNIKESTKDIDFISTDSYERINRLFKLAGLKEESKSHGPNIWYLNDIRIDIFFGSHIMGVTLPGDWRNLSDQIMTIGKIKLYILNWYDIIITKIARSEERDYSDIMAIIKSQKLDTDFLKKRYCALAEESIISDPDYKFKHLERLLK